MGEREQRDHNLHSSVGCTPKGRTATQRSERVLRRFWEGFREGVLRRVLRRESSMGFTVKKGF